MRKGLGLALAAGVLSGCFSAGHFAELPSADRQRFGRCQRSMQATLCGDDTSEIYLGNCMNVNRREYADETTPRARKRWLLEHGCPAPMVNPDAYMAQEAPPRRPDPPPVDEPNDDQPMPKRTGTPQAKDTE